MATKNFYVIDDKDKLFTKCDIPNPADPTEFADSATVGKTAHAITANGNATQLPIKFNKSAGFFNGTTDYVVVPSSTAFNFGTGDFTIELFVNFRTIQTSVFVDRNNGDIQFYFYANKLYAYVGNAAVNFSWTPAVNTWYHLMMVRTSGNVSICVDGSSIGNGALTNNLTTANALYIGNQANLSAYYSGWIKELRISNVARTVAVPTAQYTTDANTVLLMHFDTPANSPLGPAIYFDGTGDYLSVADSDDFYLDGNFTLEANIKFNATTGEQGFIGQYKDSSHYWAFGWNMSGETNKLRFVQSGNTTPHPAWAWTPTANTWYHVALVYVVATNTYTCYVNGASLGDIVNSTVAANLAASLWIGQSAWITGSYFNGSMREIRISNNARYTAPFTPSQTGFTVDANTKLYIKGDENNGVGGNNSTDIKDSSTSPKTVTCINDTKIKYTEDYRSCIFKDETGKFPYPVGSAKVDFFAIGSGVGYFDGVDDYLTIPDSDDWDVQQLAFTTEAYVRFNAVGTADKVVLVRTGANYSYYLAVSAAEKGIFKSNSGGSSRWSIEGSTIMVPYTWYHLAGVSTGSAQYLFVNGTKEGSDGSYNSALADTTDGITIGTFHDQTLDFGGLLDNIRISKGEGAARYTVTFNPPEFKKGGNQIMWVI